MEPSREPLENQLARCPRGAPVVPPWCPRRAPVVPFRCWGSLCAGEKINYARLFDFLVLANFVTSRLTSCVHVCSDTSVLHLTHVNVHVYIDYVSAEGT